MASGKFSKNHYLDNWDEHVGYVTLVLDRLRKQKQYAKLSKRTFGVQEVNYFGFVSCAGKLAMNPSKTKAIELWETPTSEKEIHPFLGLVNYYPRF